MKKNNIIGTLLIGAGLSLIFVGGLHRWYYAFIGVAYIIVSFIVILIHNKKNK